MRLLNPAALLLLALVAIVWLMPRVRRPRIRLEAGNAYMWRPVAPPSAVRVRPRLRPNLAVLLQTLVLLAVVLALARPIAFIGTSEAVLIVDVSMSMGARETAGSRLDLARTAAFDVVEKRPRRSRVRVIEAAAVPRDLGLFGASDDTLRAALDGMKPSAGPAPIDAALALARALAGATAEIHVFTDQPVQDERVFWTRVGSPRDNIAMTTLAGRRLPGAPLDAQVLAGVENFGSAPARVPIALWRDGTLIGRETIGLPSGKPGTVAWNVGDPSGVFRAAIDRADALDADNERFTMLAPARRIPVSLVTPGNFFLEHALRANPALDVRRSLPSDAPRPGDVVICDGCIEPPAEAKAVLLIPPPDRTGSLAPLRIVRAEHPMLANVDLDGIPVRVRAGATLPASSMLAGAGTFPAITAFEKNGRRVAAFQFDVNDGELPLRIAFPVLIANTVEWLAEADGMPTILEAGEPARWRSGPGRQQVTKPNGQTVAVTPAGSMTVFADTDAAGVYRVDSSAAASTFVVNPASGSESDLRSASEGRAVPRGSPAGAPVRATVDLFGPLVIAGLGLMMLEWLHASRRSAG